MLTIPASVFKGVGRSWSIFDYIDLLEKKREIFNNVRYNLNFKPKINEDRISSDQILVYTCSLKIM